MMKLDGDTVCLAAWFIIPAAFAIWWVRARLGLDKRWFVVQSWPVVSSSFYFFLPTGVLGIVVGIVNMLLVTFDPTADVLPVILFFTMLGIFGLGFILAYFEPGWMSPAWYRWLKREHGDIMPYLVMDAHEMGRQAWMQRVETQEGLEEWAAEVRRKYML